MDLDKKQTKKFTKTTLINGALILLVLSLTGYYLYKENIISSKSLSSVTSVGKKTEFTKTAPTQVIKKTLIVDLEGAVENPGVYEMEEGQRVNDLLIKAGGLNNQVNLSITANTLNKAEKLVDGMKIYIPSTNEPTNTTNVTNTSSTSTIGGKVNINTASKSELDQLPGIGSVSVDKIISGRPYSDLKDLTTKKIINSSQFENIKDQIII